MWSASLPSPPFVLVYLCANVGPRGATRRSACPILRHSESGPLGLSVHECGATGSASGQTACPVHPTLRQSWYRHGHTSPLRPGARLRPSYRSGCMFLFYLFGVGFPCRLIFCQFWLCEEAQCVYLRRHLGSPWLPLERPLLGTWPATQACALNENRTSNILFCRPALNPLNHTGQGPFSS